MRFAQFSALVAASTALLAAAIPVTASAEMMISFSGNAAYSVQGSSQPVFAPISGTFLFDPALGTVTSGTILSTYRGPISATIQLGGNTFSFANDGQVQIKDNFPQNPNDPSADPDFNDYVRVILDQTVPTGPDTVHDDFIFLYAEEFHQDFIHGLSFTQSFDVHAICCGDDDGLNRFDFGDRSASSFREQPGFIDGNFGRTEVAMHPVPEPSSAIALVTALGLMGFARRGKSGVSLPRDSERGESCYPACTASSRIACRTSCFSRPQISLR